MISKTELIALYFKPQPKKDSDIGKIEVLIIEAAQKRERVCSYAILTSKYSTALNNLKELGYLVEVETGINDEITTLKISW
jgi:hypothetical protein